MGKFGKLCCHLRPALPPRERGLWGGARWSSEVVLGVGGLVLGRGGARGSLASVSKRCLKLGASRGASQSSALRLGSFAGGPGGGGLRCCQGGHRLRYPASRDVSGEPWLRAKEKSGLETKVPSVPQGPMSPTPPTLAWGDAPSSLPRCQTPTPPPHPHPRCRPQRSPPRGGGCTPTASPPRCIRQVLGGPGVPLPRVPVLLGSGGSVPSGVARRRPRWRW